MFSRLSTFFDSPGHSPRRRRRTGGFRPGLEYLEKRLVPTTFIVDDDGVQCPDRNFSTINAAVAAANAGDVIRVCPGLYNESVVVSESIRLVAEFGGEAVGRNARQRSGLVADPTEVAIVNPPAAAGFVVSADGVVIRNFTVTGALDDAGIRLQSGFSGARIRNNVVRDNVIGLSLASDGDQLTLIHNNAFVDNDEPGAASGNGIYADVRVANTSIAGNYFTGHEENTAMLLLGIARPNRRLTISGNTIVDDGTILVSNLARSTISSNFSLRSSSNGIELSGGVRNTRVENNRLQGGLFTGINMVEGQSVLDNVDNIIRGNLITDFADAGIQLRDGATQNLVEFNRVFNTGNLSDPLNLGVGIFLRTGATENTVQGNVVRRSLTDGIRLDAAVVNRIFENDVRRNSRDGIRAEATSLDNRIRRNTMLGNVAFDAHDLSLGTGTAGTANRWVDNTCETDSPNGLCP
jgi:parallel beta-helix repeat protein